MALELAKRVAGDVTIIDLRGRCTLGEETDALDRENAQESGIEGVEAASFS